MGPLEPGYQVTSELVLLRRLGEGGMGTVWLARHAKLGIEVVVKVLSDHLVSRPEARERFLREITSTIQVRGPHVVQTLDHGVTESGVPYIVIELLEGQDLSQVIRERGALPASEVQHIVEGVASALTTAHEKGVIHRDIKASNVFLCTANPRPFVKLVDFGIAKRLDDETMTSTNAALGTPSYMSPEQWSGAAVDHRTDLWSLGVLTYFALTGTHPFRGANLANIVSAIALERTPTITAYKSDLPVALDAWLEHALARDPDKRFSSAREMADALAAALGSSTMASRPPGPVFAQAMATKPELRAPRLCARARRRRSRGRHHVEHAHVRRRGGRGCACSCACACAARAGIPGHVPRRETVGPRHRDDRGPSVAAAARAGYGIRQKEPPAPGSATAPLPPAATSGLVVDATGGAQAQPPPIAATVARAATVLPTPATAPTASTTARGRGAPGPRAAGRRQAPDDDVGF